LYLYGEALEKHHPWAQPPPAVERGRRADRKEGQASMEAVEAALATHWGGAALRPAQREAIEALLAGRDSFVGLRTGYGKSLCYQGTRPAAPIDVPSR
jgi:ATP-dependent helicase YprA (DUF1998 family)